MIDDDLMEKLFVAYMAYFRTKNPSAKNYCEYLARKADMTFEEVQHKVTSAIEVFREA